MRPGPLLVLASLGPLGCGAGAGSSPQGAPDASTLDSPGGDGATADAASDEGAAIDSGPRGDAGDAADAADDGPAPGCPAGTTRVQTGPSCTGGAVTTPPSWSAALQAGARGDVISLDTATLDAAPCLAASACQPAAAPALLFSDSPEAPSADGVLYADTVGPGAYRLYVYQVNGGASLRKFPVVILAQGADAHVTVTRRGLAGAPSTDYVGLGKAALLGWLGSTGLPALTVPAKTRALLDPALDALHAGSQQLVHAIYDVSVDAAVKISFVSVGAGEDAAALTGSLSLLPKDPGHDRGTFPGAERWIVAARPLDAASVRAVRLGALPLDPPLAGVDATTGMTASLGGNYGVLYRVKVQLATPTGLALFARGGDWGGAAVVPPGVDGTTPTVALPAASTALPAGPQAVVVGRFAASTSLEVQLLSAAGSSLPVDLAAAPVP